MLGPPNLSMGGLGGLRIYKDLRKDSRQVNNKGVNYASRK